MPRIDMSELITDQDFAQNYIVHRKSGSFVGGRWVQTETAITVNGVVSPAGSKEIMQVPEGDRTSLIMSFHSTVEIFVTRRTAAAAGTSDEIEWRGNRYRIHQVYPYADYGYYKALGISMEGV